MTAGNPLFNPILRISWWFYTTSLTLTNDCILAGCQTWLHVGTWQNISFFAGPSEMISYINALLLEHVIVILDSRQCITSQSEEGGFEKSFFVEASTPNGYQISFLYWAVGFVLYDSWAAVGRFLCDGSESDRGLAESQTVWWLNGVGVNLAAIMQGHLFVYVCI